MYCFRIPFDLTKEEIKDLLIKFYSEITGI